ncbi:hypothetical protein HELRODRAFT_177962 [Helobdella robusta]|uniref:Uncharacterized protein n=1 Tax=Helobdella robusta TaxID=6412 RepID=T1FCI9_HELRO|nr:hypothetical protein HELRODRAFT_177962 [Helobdella robusta]ESN97532.1 hypothetical protein HELRODRAFT_177962 [Helobdella robusta]
MKPEVRSRIMYLSDPQFHMDANKIWFIYRLIISRALCELTQQNRADNVPMLLGAPVGGDEHERSREDFPSDDNNNPGSLANFNIRRYYKRIIEPPSENIPLSVNRNENSQDRNLSFQDPSEPTQSNNESLNDSSDFRPPSTSLDIVASAPAILAATAAASTAAATTDSNDGSAGNLKNTTDKSEMPLKRSSSLNRIFPEPPLDLRQRNTY